MQTFTKSRAKIKSRARVRARAARARQKKITFLTKTNEHIMLVKF